MELTKKEKLFQIHKKIKNNLVEMYRICLVGTEKYVSSAPFHYKLSHILLESTKHFVIEMFRESAKSTYVLKAFPILSLAHPKEETRYITIIKQNVTLAQAKLKEIVDEYITNEVLNINLIKVVKNSADAFEAIVRAKGKKNIRVRLEAYGKGSSIRGLTWKNIRPQIIIIDDPQDLEDAQSDVTLEKDWSWFLSDVLFLSKTGRVFLIGNNLGKKCIVERVMDEPTLEFERLKIPALDEQGNSTWPEQFSTEFLMKQKAQFTALGKLDIWYRERMCQAISPETQKFKQEYFKFFEESNLPETFDIDITIDPAISKKKEACNTSIIAVAKNMYSPNWYVLDYKFGKYDPYDLINNTFEMYKELHRLYPNAFIRVWVEGVAYQEALKYVFEEEMKRAKLFIFIDTFVDRQDKKQRIEGLVPMFKIGVIFLRSWMTALIEEALLYPMGATVDIIDGLAFHQHIKINTFTQNDLPKTEEKGLLVDGNLSSLISKLQNSSLELQSDSSSHLADTYL